MRHVILLDKPDPEQRRLDSIANPRQLYPTHQCFQDMADYILTNCVASYDGIELDGSAYRPQRMPFIFNSHDPHWPEVQKVMEGQHHISSIRVAHGYINSVSRPLLHAWIEAAGMVLESYFFAGQKVIFPVRMQEWKQNAKPSDVTRYSVEAFMDRWESAMHAGPWEPRYRRHQAQLRLAAPLPGLPVSA